MVIALASLCVALWGYLLIARGQFWRNSVRDDDDLFEPANWPAVTAIIPARNEVNVIAASVSGLLRQNYKGRFSIIVVDDDSNDGTALTAQNIAAVRGARNLEVLKGEKLPAGWTGKLWAMKQGVVAAEQNASPDYLLFTDADIVHAEDTVTWLVAKAMRGRFVLTSLMAKLRCESLAERIHVPAFIYFFQMLYPFAWVRQRQTETAAAAGGCMLVRADALRAGGGIESIRNALIDDCALAKRLKATGPIWLGLTERAISIRPYETFNDIRRMVARSAYAQLGFSPLLLAGTLVALVVTFLAAPFLAIFAHGVPQLFGFITWAAMVLSFQPTLRFYRLSRLWGVALPVIALLYAGYTADSAYQHIRKRGGQWKGRIHVNAPSLP